MMSLKDLKEHHYTKQGGTCIVISQKTPLVKATGPWAAAWYKFYLSLAEFCHGKS